MLKELFVHVCIVITFLFIGGSIFRKEPSIIRLSRKLSFGALTGVLGSFLMLFSIQLSHEIILDLRHLAILVAALYGGGVSAMTSLLIICLNRILFVEGTAHSIMIVTLVYAGIAVFASLVVKTTLETWQKWMVMVLFSGSLLSIMYVYFLAPSTSTLRLLVIYWIITLVSGILVYYTASFIFDSNRIFQELTYQSKTDFLTGLNNVRQFDTVFNKAMEKSEKMNENLSLLMIDIDHFKQVNDTYGHGSGDEVLRQLGAVLSSCCRGKDIVSRNGGEEFSVLLAGTGKETALEVAERIRIHVENHLFMISDEHAIRVTVSVGASTYLETAQEPQELREQADKALYQAKNNGRNRVCFYSMDGLQAS